MVDTGTFLVEIRLAVQTAEERQLLDSMIVSAVDRSRASGRRVGPVTVTYLPDRAALLCLFEATDEEALREVLATAALPAGRVEPAVALAPLDPPRSGG